MSNKPKRHTRPDDKFVEYFIDLKGLNYANPNSPEGSMRADAFAAGFSVNEPYIDYLEARINYLSNNFQVSNTLVSPCDEHLLREYNWFISTQGYVVAKKNNKSIRLHCLIMDVPYNKHVDHINGNKLDNRRSNLRVVSNQQNQFNSKTRKDNQQGWKGAHKTGTTYWAGIRFNKENIYLGSFTSPEEAHLMYCFAAIYYFGEFACGGYRD